MLYIYIYKSILTGYGKSYNGNSGKTEKAPVTCCSVEYYIPKTDANKVCTYILLYYCTARRIRGDPQTERNNNTSVSFDMSPNLSGGYLYNDNNNSTTRLYYCSRHYFSR